ncbi:MAG: hypothetical protein V1644_00960 [Candidatus Micrarchaeota archaeon]
MGKGAYIKGARFERQLKEMLRLRGFCVIRSSKSGVDGLAPDLIALSTTKKFALECKAWKASLHFDKPKVEIMRQFENTTGIPFYIAWKQPREDWRFYPLNALKETPRGHSLMLNDLGAGMTLDDLTGVFKRENDEKIAPKPTTESTTAADDKL